VPCATEQPLQALPNARADAVTTAAFRRTSRRVCVVRVSFAASARHANVVFQTVVSTTELCRACTNRRQQFPTRRTALDVMTEVDLPTASNSQSFQEYVARNADNIRHVVTDCQNKHRYPSFTTHPHLSVSMLMFIIPHARSMSLYRRLCARRSIRVHV